MSSSAFRTLPFLLLCILVVFFTGDLQAQGTKTVAEKYPSLATYALPYVGFLPEREIEEKLKQFGLI
ncbi:MAG: hypothetical protein HY879_15505 [Deltaproteobacteria bacterium]|nr:hypothetical protein [Deltaproteobacteria bacterium]